MADEREVIGAGVQYFKINMSIKLARSLAADYIQVSYVIPYPGTQMYEEGLEKGFLIHND